MKSKKTTRRALLSSIMALVLCCAMLVGSTFAWFTDSVTSTNNIITAGNLDVELYFQVEGQTDWTKVTDQTNIFKTDTLWEPGHTEVVKLKVVNEGTLALKYQLGVNIASEIGSINKDGKEFKLSDYIKFGIIEGAQDYTREQAIAAVDATATALKQAYSSEITKLLPETAANTDNEDVVTLVVWMPETVGNEANYGKDQATPIINLGINLYATQVQAENDSFGNDYDKDAYLPTVYTAEELISALTNGESVKLGDNIQLPTSEPIVIPQGKTSVLDLNGMDLSSADPASAYVINNLGTLTLMDSGSSRSRAVSARGIYNGYDADGNHVVTAKLTILSGEYNAMGTNGGAAVYNYGEVVIESGTFTSKGGYALNNQSTGKMTVSNASVTGGIYNLGELTLNDSKVYQHISGRHAIYNWKGSVVINGGEFDSESGNELILADGTDASVVINGGTFDKTAKSWLFGAATNKNITFTINGGTFNGYVNKPENTVDTIRPYGDPIVVNGGTFNFDPTNWLGAGFTVVSNNGTWTVSRDYTEVTAPGTDPAANGQALADVINNTTEASFLSLPAGEYKMPSIDGSKEFTIVGTKDTVIDVTQGAYMDGSKVVFEGVTIKVSTGMANGNGSDYAALYTPNVTYINCTFIGPMRVGRDGAQFINCTFNNLGNDYIWTYGNDVTFDGCTFNTDGKAILIYSDGGSEVSKVIVKNCTFNATQGAKAGAIANQNCAAIEIQNYGHGVDLITSGNTLDSDFSGEWRIKTYHEGHAKIIVNGVEYTSIAIDGKTMTIDGSKNVTVNG